MKLCNTYHKGFLRIHISACYSLQGQHYMRPNDYRVYSLMRHSRMRSPAFNKNLKIIPSGHNRPRTNCKFSNFDTRDIMHSIDFIHWEQLKQAVCNHLFTATFTFLSRLKYELNRTIKIFSFRKIFCCTQKHCCMTIVATSMHHARVF